MGTVLIVAPPPIKNPEILIEEEIPEETGLIDWEEVLRTITNDLDSDLEKEEELLEVGAGSGTRTHTLD